MTRSAPAELTELGPVQFPPDASTDSRRRRQTLMIDPHRHGVAQQSCTNSNRSNREPRSTLRCAMGAPSDRRPLCGAFRAPMCSTPERSGPSQLRNAERTVVARCRSLDRTPLTIPIGGVHSCGYPWKKQRLRAHDDQATNTTSRLSQLADPFRLDWAGSIVPIDQGSSSTVTTPVSPFTSINAPLGIRSVALLTETTQGMPSSRLTMIA